MSNNKNTSSPDKVCSRANAVSKRYRPNKKPRPLGQYAFNMDANTIEYRRKMISSGLVTSQGLAIAAREIAEETANRLNGKRRKRRQNRPKMDVSVFAGLKITDIEI